MYGNEISVWNVALSDLENTYFSLKGCKSYRFIVDVLKDLGTVARNFGILYITAP